MSNHVFSLLDAWYPQKDDHQWVLASIVNTQGSAYRKTGAMMLFNSLGKSLGLLSGGCLEADLLRHAQKCLQQNRSISVCYDTQDDSDITWQLGLGCGGIVNILLQPVNAQNNYQALTQLYLQLKEQITCYYVVNTQQNGINKRISWQDFSSPTCHNAPIFILKPPVSLVIFGGGLDALPLVNMAKNLSWQVHVVDQRSAYARQSVFNNADTLIKQPLDSMTIESASNGVLTNVLNKANAIVIMQHNIELDAKALSLVATTSAEFIGLLGPKHRTEKIFQHEYLKHTRFNRTLSNPIGLDLGGELPESIALSILSQAHAIIEKTTGLPLGSYTPNQPKVFASVG